MLEELIIRTLCDNLPETTVDAVYLFAQTEDNQESVFATAQHLIQCAMTQSIACMYTPPMSGYPGYENWQKALVSHRIPVNQLEAIHPVPADTTMLHTRIEAESLLWHAKQKGYKRIIVTAAPFQQTRAFMAAVTLAVTEYPALKIYSYPGKALPWHQEVMHSQGTLKATRAGLIAGETERIATYIQKGDLLPVKDVLEYLNKRDT